ncbi:MAG: sugar transferase [Eubacteriales bacterium]|nr:sugar transferase [Eubacteriales bacterium]
MYKKEKKGWLKHLDFMVLDLAVFQICYIAAYWILRGVSNPYRIVLYRYQGIVYFLCQLIVVLFSESYKNVLRRGPAAELICTFRYIASVELLNLVYLFSVHQIYLISRLLTGITAVLFFFVSFFVRQANKKRILRTRKDQKGQRSLMVFTSSHLVEEVIGNLSDNSFHDYFISGIILMDQATSEKRELHGIPVLGRGENILFYIGRNWVDEVFLYQPDNLPYPTELVDTLLGMGITVHYCISALNEDRWGVQEVEKIGNYKVLTNSLRIVSIRELALKRAIDIAGAIVGCILTGIIFIFIAPIIYKQSPGPIFFSQERIGKNGKKFRMYKFRSMYMDAEERKKALMDQNRVSSGMMFKMEDDPRIIGSEKKDRKGRPAGIGNFIRRTSLDEFPQFWNVLKGDMSLVGTRPPTVDEWEKYDLHHRVRMSIKPGITGLWQISGRSEITDFEEVVRLDREYIQSWSPELDLQIILKTVSVVLRGDGAK